MTPTNGHDGQVPRSQTIEYHRPSRSSALYAAGADVSLGMVPAGSLHTSSASSSPHIPQGNGYSTSNGASDRVHGPSAFRSPPLTSPLNSPLNEYETGSSVQRHASRRNSSMGNSSITSSPAANYSPAVGSASRPTLPSGAQSYQSKSATNSPNPNRYSSGGTSNPNGPPGSMAMTSNGAPPPRPTRAGTLPLDQQLGLNMNGLGNYRDRERDAVSPSTSVRSPTGFPSATQSQFASQPTPPPLHHQPFSAPGNPYAGGLEKDFDEKVGLGVGVPMGVVEPRDKELPEKPITMGRNRSGTGKSLKDKKSVFGVLSG
jgi:p21-activated kinase 1